MKKLILFTGLVLSVSACSNNAKTEEQEKRERDSTDKLQVMQNENLVDSIMKADMEKEAKDSAAGMQH